MIFLQQNLSNCSYKIHAWRLIRSIKTCVFDTCKRKWKASIFLFKMGLPKAHSANPIQTLFYPIYFSLQFNTFISRERISPIPLSSLLYLSSLKAVTFFHSFFPSYKNKQNIFRIVLQRLGKCSANSRSFYISCGCIRRRFQVWKIFIVNLSCN